jgi:hypothetical protein
MTPVADMTARFEVWFMSDDQVSVFVETSREAGPVDMREVLETAVFAALAAGVIANLPKDRATTLCEHLARFPRPTSHDDIPTSVDGLDLVLPRFERDRKGVEGTFTMKGGLPITRLKFRGFGLLGNGHVQDCAQIATNAVLLHLLAGLTPNGRAVLVETAHALGKLGLSGAITMTTHPQAAMAALDQAVEALDNEPGEEDGRR